MNTGVAAVPTRRLRVSVFVVGCGLLILVSFLIPFFKVPFWGDRYMQWLSAVTLVLGTTALVRRERGRLAIVSAAVTVVALGLLVLTVVFPVGYSLAMKFLMPD